MNETITQQFDSIVYRYNTLVEIAKKVDKKPTVLLGLPWQGTWYISGSKSYMAQLIKDAGASYIFDHFHFNESRPIGLEKIYESALTAEYWINPGEARSLNDIVSVDERFGTLPAVITNKVYNNDRFMVAGGNAIYEEGVTEPDIILADLISILHPQLLASHKLKYYRKLQ
jgi:iron complex transport system substrate-binding protein